MSLILSAVFLLGIVIGGIVLLTKLFTNREANSSIAGDLIGYGLLAIFVGGTVWSLFLLGRAAFPENSLVEMTQQDLAGALAGLIVSGPLAFILWRRQDERRDTYPDSAGWSVYLAFTDLVYLTWLVVYAISIFIYIFEDGDLPRITDVLIIAGVVALHEWASRVDRPGGAISQIHRIVGSAIGLFTLALGVGWLLWWLFYEIYGTFTAVAGETSFGLGLSILLVGAVVWYFRWLAPWRSTPDGTYLTYLVVVTTNALLVFLGTGTAIAIIALLYLFGADGPPGEHFEPVPGLLAVMATAGLVFFHHRPRFAAGRTNALRSYQYLIAASGLGVAVGATTSLIAAVFTDELVAGDLRSVVVAALVTAVVAILTWWIFWTEAQAAPRAEEANSLPRKLYVIGLAIIFGLTAAGSVIAILLYVFQTLLGLDPDNTALAVEVGLAAMSGAITFHLFNQNKQDSGLREGRETRPYLVTVIASHPGPLAGLLPREASLRMIHRGDGVGTIDEELALEIVEATRGINSIVWVGHAGIEVVPALES